MILVRWFYNQHQTKSYSFFIEFSNSQGINRGTSVRMRGIEIGYVENIRLKLNSVLVSVQINSSKILIPRNSLVETTQTGLLNEPLIDIVPLQLFSSTNNVSPFSSTCSNSFIICNHAYIIGDRGLNYDDLIRSTTRISQRFDDPRFFSLFYVFLQNGIEFTDTLLDLMSYLLDFTSSFSIYLRGLLIDESLS